MAQLSVVINSPNVSSTSDYQVNIDDFKDSISITRYTKNHIDILIWGDVAYRCLDQTIITQLTQNRFNVFCGRSWMMINQLTQKISIGIDKYGCFPMLFFKNEQHTIFSSSRSALKQSLNSPLMLNKNAMRQLVALGQLFGNESILQNTTHLSANTVTCVDTTTGEYTTQFKANRTFLPTTTSKYKDAKDALIESVRKCVTSSTSPLISLSGGLDSRAILAVCDLLNFKPDALCYGVANSTDVTYAKLLANSCGLKLFKPDSLTTNLSNTVINLVSNASMGEVPYHHAHALIDDKILNKTIGRTIITGTGAESYRAFYYDRGMPGFNLFDYESLNRWTVPKIKRYIEEEFLKQTRPIADLLLSKDACHEKVESVFSRYIDPALAATKQADLFYLTTRCQRMVIAGQQLLDSYYNRSHPFLNDDVVQTMLHLPASLKLRSNFHRKFIADISPKLANLPWDKTEKPLNQGLNFSETYPGLARKLKLQAKYGKATKPMYQYNYAHLDQNLLTQSLLLLAKDENELHELHQLVEKHNLQNYIIGFGLVWLNMNNKFQLEKTG